MRRGISRIGEEDLIVRRERERERERERAGIRREVEFADETGE